MANTAMYREEIVISVNDEEAVRHIKRAEQRINRTVDSIQRHANTLNKMHIAPVVEITDRAKKPLERTRLTMDQLNRTNVNIKTSTSGNLLRDVNDAQSSLNRLNRTRANPTVELDGHALLDLQRLGKRTQQLGSERLTIHTGTDGKLMNDLEESRSAINRLNRAHANPKVEIDGYALQELQRLEKRIQQLEGDRLTVQTRTDGKLLADLEDSQSALNRLSRTHANPTVEVDGYALQELSRIERRMEQLESERYNMHLFLLETVTQQLDSVQRKLHEATNKVYSVKLAADDKAKPKISDVTRQAHKFGQMSEAATVSINDKASSKLDQIEEKLNRIKDITLIVGATGLATGAAATGVGVATSTNDALAAGQTSLSKDYITKTIRQVYYDQHAGTSRDNVSTSIKDISQQTALRGESLRAAASAINKLNTLDPEADVSEIVRAFATTHNSQKIGFNRIADNLAYIKKNAGDSYDDLYDTFNEYATTFAKYQISPERLTSGLVAAQKGGLYNYDKAGDSIREFFIKSFIDQSDDTMDAYNSVIGKKRTKQLYKGVASGDISGEQVMMEFVAGLSKVKNKNDQDAYAANAFGSMYEDNREGVLALVRGMREEADVAGQLNKQFKKMRENDPSTAIKDTWDSIRKGVEQLGDTALNKAAPHFKELNKFLASTEGKEALKDFEKAVGHLSDVLSGSVVSSIEFVVNHWDTLQPILLGVGIAFASLTAISLLVVKPLKAIIGIFETLSKFKNIGKGIFSKGQMDNNQSNRRSSGGFGGGSRCECCTSEGNDRRGKKQRKRSNRRGNIPTDPDYGQDPIDNNRRSERNRTRSSSTRKGKSGIFSRIFNRGAEELMDTPVTTRSGRRKSGNFFTKLFKRKPDQVISESTSPLRYSSGRRGMNTPTSTTVTNTGSTTRRTTRPNYAPLPRGGSSTHGFISGGPVNSLFDGAERLAGRLPDSKISKGLLGAGKAVGKKIPLLGTALAVTDFLKADSGKERGAAVGSAAGGLVGGAVGSLLGPVGTIAGGALGSMAGGALGGKIGDMKGVQDFFSSIGDFTSKANEKISEWISSLPEKFSSFMDTTSSYFSSLPDKFATWFENAKSAATGKLQEFRDLAVEKFNGFLEDTSSFFSGLPGKFAEWFESAKSTAAEKLQGLWDSAVEKLSGFSDMITSYVGDIPSKFAEWFESAKITAAEKLQGLWDSSVEKLSGFTDMVTSYIGGLPGKFTEWFESAKNTAIEKLQSLWTSATEKFSGFVNAATSYIGSLSGKFSAWFESAKSIAAEKLQSLKDSATEKFSGLVNSATTYLSSLPGKFSAWFKQAKDNAVTQVSELPGKVRDYLNKIPEQATKAISFIWKAFKSLGGKIPEAVGDGISAMASKATDGVRSLGKSMASGLKSVVDTITQSGINKLLDTLGVDSKYHVPKLKIPGYAHGTNAHPGGLALLGDGVGANSGPELYQTPSGHMGLSPATNTLMDLPKGTKVLSATNTRKVMADIPFYSKGNSTPSEFLSSAGSSIKSGAKSLFKSGKNAASSVAKGTKKAAKAGDIVDGTKSAASKTKDFAFDVWQYASDPTKLMNKVLDSLNLSLPNIPGAFGGIATGVVKKVKEASVAYIKKKVENFGEGFFMGSGNAPGNVKSWIMQAIGLTGAPGSWLGPLTTIAMKESGGRTGAGTINRWDINAKRGTPSMGLMQTIGPTFNAFKVKGHNDIMNPVDNAAAAINYIKKRYGTPFNTPGIRSMARGGPYKGYATGGVATYPQVATLAEHGHPEWIIPSEPSMRGNAVKLLGQANQVLGDPLGVNQVRGYEALTPPYQNAEYQSIERYEDNPVAAPSYPEQPNRGGSGDTYVDVGGVTVHYDGDPTDVDAIVEKAAEEFSKDLREALENMND